MAVAYTFAYIYKYFLQQLFRFTPHSSLGPSLLMQRVGLPKMWSLAASQAHCDN